CHWMFGMGGFHVGICIMAAILGAVLAAVYSIFEKIPAPVGIVPGLLMGAGAYTVAVYYLSIRHALYLVEIAIPSVLGALAGVAMYVIIVRLYYWWTGD